METELAALAVSGATTLVGLMAGDAWTSAKARITALLGRGRPGRGDSVADELEESQRELIAARDSGDESSVADIEAMWRLRIRQLLREEPEAADEVRALIAEASGATRPTTTVQNTISGGGFRSQVIQTGAINGDLYFR
ncbi:hypothetical protein [Peterkaempfera bronchialis]|uniref:hypothetical protein n=1 Tax=Peterkaempfera bronchialis TaxID=2126346 RepID=UPI003C2C4234